MIPAYSKSGSDQMVVRPGNVLIPDESKALRATEYRYMYTRTIAMIRKSKAIIIMGSTLVTNPVSVLVIVISSNRIGGNRKLFLTIDERRSK